MDDNNSSQPKINPKMEGLFMECEEEELEPWQRPVEAPENEEDDELIFVGEISGSKPPISNILNRGNSSNTSLKSAKSEPNSSGIPAIFRTTSRFHLTRTPSPTASSKSKSPERSSQEQSTSNEPAFQIPVISNVSSVVIFDLTQDSPSPKQTPVEQTPSPKQMPVEQTPPSLEETQAEVVIGVSQFLTQTQTQPLLKRPSASQVNSVSPKKSKISESTSNLNNSASLTSTQVKRSRDTKSSASQASQNKPGTPSPKFCPKCNAKFSVLDLLKYHMKRCCPGMIRDYFGNTDAKCSSTENRNTDAKRSSTENRNTDAKRSSTENRNTDAKRSSTENRNTDAKRSSTENRNTDAKRSSTENRNTDAKRSSTENRNKTAVEKGKLIMLVSDFYYGRHEGVIEEQKTYTTFKCFSCLKVLKNNIRFMNHMKHHMELEKQNSESWENHTTCQHCYRQYPTPFQLQCHIESTHTPHEFSTICKICELSFESEHTLLQHMKDTHKPGEMPYICQVCQYRSSWFSEVDRHFRASHENTKNLLCPFCLKVGKMATPFMNHYMKHQKKGIHRCAKCRLQFLTCKEKTEHKIQHRTFIKPKQLVGLPPGTKVTVRASHGPVQSKPSTAIATSTPSTSLQLSPQMAKTKTSKSYFKSGRSKSTRPSKSLGAASSPRKRTASKASPVRARNKLHILYRQKQQRNRKSRISTALKNLRCPQGNYKCIECHSNIKDFASHFSKDNHCQFCKYCTNCNKAFINHMMSSHSNQPSKRFCLFKKDTRTARGITLVCLKCDFLVDSSGVDLMAKHLSQRKTHTCQVIKEESVSRNILDSEPTSHSSLR